jgi:hypothetical protein
MALAAGQEKEKAWTRSAFRSLIAGQKLGLYTLFHHR